MLTEIIAYLLGLATIPTAYLLRPLHKWLFRKHLFRRQCNACQRPIHGARWRQPTVRHLGHSLPLSLGIHLIYCPGARKRTREYAETTEPPC